MAHQGKESYQGQKGNVFFFFKLTLSVLLIEMTNEPSYPCVCTKRGSQV